MKFVTVMPRVQVAATSSHFADTIRRW